MKDANIDRELGIDVIRVLAMLMVIVLHTWMAFTLRTDFFNTKLWWILEPFVAVSKVAVLLFFMVSGYLSISKHRSITQTLHKTFWRVIVPMFCFQMLTSWYMWFKSGVQFADFILPHLGYLTTFPNSPLWFLHVLVFLYLINPLIHVVFSSKNSRNLSVYIGIGSFLFTALVTLLTYPGKDSLPTFSVFTAWTGFLCFYLYGGLVKYAYVKIDNRVFNIFLVAVGVIGTIAGDYVSMFTQINGTSSSWFAYTGNYGSIPVLLASVGIFNVVMHLEWNEYLSKLPNLTKILLWFSSLSYGIYLTHTWIVSLFTDYLGLHFDNLKINVYVFNIVNYSLVLGISTLITIVLKCTPVLKRSIGEG